MKTITIRLPEMLAADIETEARERKISKSDVVRQRLEQTRDPGPSPTFNALADLIGSVRDGLPTDLSARKKHYLRSMGYGRNRSR